MVTPARSHEMSQTASGAPGSALCRVDINSDGENVLKVKEIPLRVGTLRRLQALRYGLGHAMDKTLFRRYAWRSQRVGAGSFQTFA